MNYRSMAAVLAAGTTLAACTHGDISNLSVSPVTSNQVETRSMLNSTGTGGLYVASHTGVAVYGDSPLQYVRSITNGVSQPNGIVFDSKGQLLVANEGSNTVTIYKANGSSPVRTLTNKFLKNPFAEAVSSKDDLYVLAERFTNVFVNARQKGVKQIVGGGGSIAADGSNNIYTPGSGVINVTAAPGTKPFKTIGQGISGVTSLAVDAAGNLYVGSINPNPCGSVAVYHAATGKFERTITSGVCDPAGLAFDSRNDVYVSNYASGETTNQSVTEYSAGKGALLETITSGIHGPDSLAVDPLGNLYVANLGQPGNVTVYPPGEITPSDILTTGINYPTSLKWLP